MLNFSKTTWYNTRIIRVFYFLNHTSVFLRMITYHTRMLELCSNESTPLTAYGSRLVGWVSGWMRRRWSGQRVWIIILHVCYDTTHSTLRLTGSTPSTARHGHWVRNPIRRPLSRIFQKIRLAEPHFRLISGLAEFCGSYGIRLKIRPNTTNSANKTDNLRQSNSKYMQHNKGVWSFDACTLVLHWKDLRTTQYKFVGGEHT